MEHFCIKLAEVAIGISAEFPETRVYCEGFLTDDVPEIKILLAKQDREDTRQKLIEIDRAEGRALGNYPESLLELNTLYKRTMDEMIRYDAVPFHGCVVAAGGKVYMFCADSGTGKSTLAMLWVKNIRGCHILNGDKPLLMFRNGSVCQVAHPGEARSISVQMKFCPCGAMPAGTGYMQSHRAGIFQRELSRAAAVFLPSRRHKRRAAVYETDAEACICPSLPTWLQHGG